MTQLTSTQVNVNFSIRTDNDFALLMMLFILWYVKKTSHEIKMILQDFRKAFQVTAKICAIGFNSIKWSVLP